MSLEYRIYANDLRGGPVDLSAPLDTVSGLTWDTPTLPPNADATFLVRAYDTGSGLEDENTDARVRVRLDALSNDVTGYPRAPIGLTAMAVAGGQARVNWMVPPGANASGASVYAWADADPPNYDDEVVNVAVDRGNPAKRYSATVAGLSDGVLYRVGVRLFNASGEEQNTVTVTVTGRSAGPAAVVPVSAAATP